MAGPGDRATEETLEAVEETLDLVLERLAHRPSQMNGRTPVHATGVIDGTGALTHEVTDGKVFYLTSYTASARLAGTTSGLLQVIDGVGGSIKRQWVLPRKQAQTTGNNVPDEPHFVVSETLPEPIPFTDSVRFKELFGASVDARLSISGYEEDP